MGTKDFNIIDIFIARWRLLKITKYIHSTDTILDFGCGHQAFFLHHIKHNIGKGYGIDYDVHTINNKNLHLKKFRFKKHLPFDTNFFDKVFLLAVIEHIELSTVVSLVSELHRVMKPEGLLILTTPTPASKGVLEFLANKFKIISQAEIADHIKYYSKNDLQELFSLSRGFSLIKYDFFQFGLNSLAVFQKNV